MELSSCWGLFKKEVLGVVETDPDWASLSFQEFLGKHSCKTLIRGTNMSFIKQTLMYFHRCWISSIKRDVNMITLWLLEKSESTSSTFGLCLGGFAIILLVGFENDSDFQRHTWSSDADFHVQTTDSLSIKPATNSQVRTCHFGKMFSKRKGQFLWPEEGANRSNFGMFFFVVEIVPDFRHPKRLRYVARKG